MFRPVARNRCTGLGLPSAISWHFQWQWKEDMGNALGIAQFGGTAPTAKPWKGLGPGVLELVEAHDGNAYRAVYTVRFEKAIYVFMRFRRNRRLGFGRPSGTSISSPNG